MRVLSVTSGGMDSMSMAAKCLYDGHEVALFHGDLKQKSEQQERQAVVACATLLGMKAYFIDLSWLGKMGGSSLTDAKIEPSKGFESLQESLLITKDFLEKQKEGKGLWTPARNLVLLAVASAIAERYGFDLLTWGANQSETAYPDNTMEFAKRFEQILEYGCLRRIRVDAPLYNMDKVEILKWGFEHDFGSIYTYTWSCDLGYTLPCGQCGCCMNRRLAFYIIKLIEPETSCIDTQDYVDEEYFWIDFLPKISKDKRKIRGMWFEKYYGVFAKKDRK